MKHRVVQFVGKLGTGGLETFAIDCVKRLPKSLFSFDFVVTRDIEEPREAEIINLGCRKIVLGKEGGHILSKGLRFVKYIKENDDIEIVHFHCSEPYSQIQYLIGAKLFKKKVVVHSHSSNGNRVVPKILIAICRQIVWLLADVQIACSKEAARWLFPKSKNDKVIILHNGIEVEKFRFSKTKRCTYKEEFGFTEDLFIVGQIGRLSVEKNHIFSLELLKCLVQTGADKVRLLILGDGDLLEDLLNYSKELGIDDKVFFAGYRKDIPSLYSVLDVLIMPSLYEGYPITAVEAQANGLKILMSEAVTREVVVSHNASFLPLDIGVWEGAIKDLIRCKTGRIKGINDNCVVDISDVAMSIYSLYMPLLS